MHRLSVLAGLAILIGLAAGSAAGAPQSVTCTSFSPLNPGGQNSYAGSGFTSAYWDFVASPSNCNWAITATTGNITYDATQIGTTSGTGSGRIYAVILLNQTSQVTVGTVTISSGPNTYIMTVYENPVSCQYTPYPSSMGSVGSSGGNYAITVIPSPSACLWQLDSPQSWIHQPLDSNGDDVIQTGPQTVLVAFDANDGPARSGSLTVSGGAPVTIPVTQSATGAPTLQLSAHSASGIGLVGSSVLLTGSPISITSSGAPITFTISTQTNTIGPTWLSVSLAGGTTPNSLSITANLQGLAPGSYSGTVIVTPTSSNSNGPQTINISLTAQGTDALQVTYAPNVNQTLTLTYPSVLTGSIQVSSSNALIAGMYFSASSSVLSPAGGSWLTIAPSGSPFQTNTTIIVSAQRGSLPQGTYNGRVTLYDTNNNPTSVLVVFVVPQPPAITAACLGCSGIGSTGQTVALGSVSVGSSDTAQPITFSVSTGTANTVGPSWLKVSSNTGTTPSTISVTANLTGLAQGNYSGSITVTPTSLTSNGQQLLSAAVEVVNGTLQVTWTVGQKQNQAANQVMALTSPSAASGTINLSGGAAVLNYAYQIKAGANWLQASPPPPAAAPGLQTPGTLAVTAAAGLAPSAQPYQGRIDILDSANNTTSVTVTLTVPIPPSLTADNTNLAFTPGPANAAPASKTVNLTASDGSHLGFSVNPSNNWFTAVPNQNTTPATLTVSVPSPLPSVSASGTITVSPSPGNGTAAVVINVSFTPSNGPSITFLQVTSTQSPTISQNAWIEIHGTNLSQGTPQDWSTQDFSNGLPLSIAGVSATVDGKSAAIYYISPTQVNVLTPLDPATGLVPVQLKTQLGSSAVMMATEAQASPAFLLIDPTGHVAARHSDYSLLGPASSSIPGYTFTPAAPGETVLLYATGFGQTSPPITNQLTGRGSLPSPLPTALIGGLPATVTGAALSGAGLYQLNVIVPAGAVNGDNSVVATYNGFTTQSGVFITVQR